MKITALLTTYNRPRLLQQSLHHIERECANVGAQLVIADDESDNFQTKTILESAKATHDVIVRKWGRTQYDNPHYSLGFHAVFSFKYVLNKYNPDVILKLDDDCVLSEGALPCLIKAYEQALNDGYDVLACSGLQGIYEHQTQAFEDRCYCLIDHPCAVTCLYPARYFKIYLDNTPEGEIATSGWDHKFLDFRHKWLPDTVFINTFPFDVAFHAGFSGTHLINTDVNRPGKFCGNLDGVYIE